MAHHPYIKNVTWTPAPLDAAKARVESGDLSFEAIGALTIAHGEKLVAEAAAEPAVKVLIAPSAGGLFYVYDSNNRVWDGEEWRGFGAPEYFYTYGAAMAGRRLAIAKTAPA